MDISELGLALIRQFEGLRLLAYRDQGGKLTIGFGHTGPDVHEGQVISESEAERLLHLDSRVAVNTLNEQVKHPIEQTINQNQFDACADFIFNLGSGNFAKSTLLSAINRGDLVKAAAQFPLWAHVHGSSKPNDGLMRRRLAEQALFVK